MKPAASAPFATRLKALREMPWENFSLVVSESYRRRVLLIDADLRRVKKVVISRISVVPAEDTGRE